MFCIKCDEYKNKSWSHWCQGKPCQCFVCRVVTYRDKHDHLLEHYNNPNQYLTCRKCKLYKHISKYRFKQFYYRLCDKERFRRRKPSEAWKSSEAWEPSETSNCIIIINL